MTATSRPCWYPLFGHRAGVLLPSWRTVYSSNISNVLSPAQRFFWMLGGVLWLWALIELGFMPGTKGPNRYGPDPRDAAEAPATRLEGTASKARVRLI